MAFLTVGDVARDLSRDIGKPVSPKMVSTLLYDQRVNGIEFPLVCGRRMIPPDAFGTIREAIEKRLARRGGAKRA